MYKMRYATEADREFWFSLDRHLSVQEWERKLTANQAYILCVCADEEAGTPEVPVGVFRYNLFWDNTPFLNLIFLDSDFRGKGLGRFAMLQWESEMRDFGFGMTLVSTQVDEDAQHFYRKLGYQDIGGLIFTIPGYEQPMELFLAKDIRKMTVISLTRKIDAIDF